MISMMLRLVFLPWRGVTDALTNSMNYKPVVAENQSNGNAGTKACDNTGKARVKTEEKKDAEDLGNESKVPSTEGPRINQAKDDNINNTNNIDTASDENNTNNVNVVSLTVNAAGT
ncbi:hypothetical protein Tco_1027415 [Tanacetum coccineum]